MRLLLFLAILIGLTVAVTIYNNSLRSAPIFLFLLTLGMSLMITHGLKRRGLFGLVIISLSVATKQFIGAWSRSNLLFNVVETLLLAITLAMSGYYYDQLQDYFEQFAQAEQQLKILDLEDTDVGLIRPAIGLLRLREETDRAMRFRRPISLVLIHIQPKASLSWDSKQRLSVMRAVATTLKDTTRVQDIPFSLDTERIALILTDTEINGTNKVINNIQRKLLNSKAITPDGSSELLQQSAIIRFGFSVFLGLSVQRIDLQQAAQAALQRNIEMNAGDIFQNLFIDWESVGETPAFNTINAVMAEANKILTTHDLNVPMAEVSQES